MLFWISIVIGAAVLVAIAGYGALRATLRLRDNTLNKLDTRLRYLSENHSVQSENLSYLYMLLDWREGMLPATKMWAASPDFLVILAEWVLTHKPKIVLEFGTGITSMVIARALQFNGSGRLISVDHDDVFGTLTQSRLVRHGLRTEYVYAPLVKTSNAEGEEALWYDYPGSEIPIDLFVIDGPPKEYGEHIRSGASRYFSKLSKNATVLLDDAIRPGERAIALAWAAQWPALKQTMIDTEKGTLLLQKRSDRKN